MQIPHIRLFLLAASFAGLAEVASAQLTSVGPFTGTSREDFESTLQGSIPSCHPKRILDGMAELCATNGANLFVGGASHCICVLQPYQGQIQAMAAYPGHARIRFAAPVTRFGGYFALNCGVADGRADVFDESGVLLGSIPLTIPADCTWHWAGFEVQGGPPIGSVELYSNLASGPAVHMDALEADVAYSIARYCTGKPNSLGCIPRIEVDGRPTAGATSGFVVRAYRVRPGAIPGTLLYAVGGARNAQPFQCGTLCVGPSGVRRTIATFSSYPGSLCDGTYSLDMNAFASGALGSFPSAALSVPGTMVRCQWWGRDQGFAPPCATTLTDGIEYVVQ